MKVLVFGRALIFLMMMCALATADPLVGQIVAYKADSSHTYPAVVTGVEDPTTVSLVAFSKGTTWFNSVAASVPSQVFASVAHGTTDNRWTEYVWPVLATQFTPSFSLNGSAVQLSTTNDTELILTVQISLTLTLVAGMGGSVHLFCDSASNPTTEVQTAQLAHGLGIATTLSQTQVLRHRVLASHFCKVTTTNDTGTPSFAMPRQFGQTIN